MKLSELKQQQILNVARELFLSLGVKQTSMQSVADKAKVSKRTLYKYFADKDALLSAILGLLYQDILHKAAIKYDAKRSIREQLQQLLIAKSEVMKDPAYIGMAKIVLPEIIGNPERSQKLMEFMQPIDGPLIRWLEAAKLSGKIKMENLPQSAIQIQGMLDSVFFWPGLLFGHLSITPEQEQQSIDRTVEFIITNYVVTE